MNDDHSQTDALNTKMPGHQTMRAETVTAPPRVTIIEKGAGGLLTWGDDIIAAFAAAGVNHGRINLRPSSLAERLDQFRQGVRLFQNPSTCQRIARELARFAPDLVLVLNYAGLPPATERILRAALRPNVPIVGWLCDRLEDLPAGQLPLLDGVYYFDSYCRPVLEKIYANQPAQLAYLPLAASPARFPLQQIAYQERKLRLAFAGNCTPARKTIFDEYRTLGGELDLYGPHSGGWRQPWRNRRLPSATLVDLYCRHLVNLNLLQTENTQNGLNLRAFEIPCAGGLGTYPDVPDVSRCFIPGEEIVVYHSLADLKAKVEHLLRHPARAAAIAEAGHRRVMREHTFNHRTAQILRDWLPQPVGPNGACGS